MLLHHSAQLHSLPHAFQRMQSQYHLVDMISENAVPPVCRLLNHSKVAYEAKVKERQAEKKQNENRRVALIKEVGLSCCVRFS